MSIFPWYPTADQSHYQQSFSYHEMSPRWHSSIGLISIRRQSQYRADTKTISKLHLDRCFFDKDVQHLSDIEWPSCTNKIILSYRYRSDINCYNGQILLRHRMVNFFSKIGLINIDSMSGIISVRHSLADDRAISNWHNYLCIADEEVRCLSDTVRATS